MFVSIITIVITLILLNVIINKQKKISQEVNENLSVEPLESKETIIPTVQDIEKDTIAEKIQEQKKLYYEAKHKQEEIRQAEYDNYIKEFEKQEIERTEQIAQENERRKEMYRQRSIRKCVNQYSKCLKEIKQLNKQTNLKKYEEVHEIYKECISKAQYDTFNLDNYMLSIIGQDFDYFNTMLNDIDENITIYDGYLEEYNNILSRNRKDKKYYQEVIQDKNFTVIEFKKCELECCKIEKLEPENEDLTINVIVIYKSPQGNNNYEKTINLKYPQFKEYMQKYYDMQRRKESAEYQRSLLTPKLRYLIMKRDNFKCVICGASQKDGATLHVDHIKPVSLGGKTEESNLRTLCDKCNLGKSDMYDPEGLN